MLLQTNSYVVPKERRSEHARILRRFKQALQRLGCDQFEVYEQAGANWAADEGSGRFVQIMRFRDRRHQLAVQAAERNDAMAQAIIAEFCELINFQYQNQQGLFAIGYYTSILNSGRDREVEHSHTQQMASDAGPPPRANPPYPQSAVLDSVLAHAEPPQEQPSAPPTEIIEQATALADAPFADIPMHEPAGSPNEPITSEVTPINGSALSREPSPESIDPRASARELDQMIRRHFGEESQSNGSLSAELGNDLNGHDGMSRDTASEVDAIRDSDLDLVDAFPANLVHPDELLEGGDPLKPNENPDHAAASHVHAPPIEDFDRDQSAL
jgi:hypothetical protein